MKKQKKPIEIIFLNRNNRRVADFFVKFCDAILDVDVLRVSMGQFDAIFLEKKCAMRFSMRCDQVIVIPNFTTNFVSFFSQNKVLPKTKVQKMKVENKRRPF